MQIDWRATPDDAAAIGERIGIMPPGSVAAYRQDSAAQAAPSSVDEARLSASSELRDYLTERIVATQDGQPCQSEVAPVADFVHRGARVIVTCPADIDDVALRIAMLHDIHQAYRTVAVAADARPSSSVFTVAAPQHRFTFGAGANAAGGIAAAVAVGIFLAAGAAVVLLRRRSRS